MVFTAITNKSAFITIFQNMRRTLFQTFINSSVPKNTPWDTHKTRKPLVAQLEQQKTHFRKLKFGNFLEKSHSAEKG